MTGAASGLKTMRHRHVQLRSAPPVSPWPTQHRCGQERVPRVDVFAPGVLHAAVEWRLSFSPNGARPLSTSVGWWPGTRERASSRRRTAAAWQRSGDVLPLSGSHAAWIPSSRAGPIGLIVDAAGGRRSVRLDLWCPPLGQAWVTPVPSPRPGRRSTSVAEVDRQAPCTSRAWRAGPDGTSTSAQRAERTAATAARGVGRRQLQRALGSSNRKSHGRAPPPCSSHAGQAATRCRLAWLGDLYSHANPRRFSAGENLTLLIPRPTIQRPWSGKAHAVLRPRARATTRSTAGCGCALARGRVVPGGGRRAERRRVRIAPGVAGLSSEQASGATAGAVRTRTGALGIRRPVALRHRRWHNA